MKENKLKKLKESKTSKRKYIADTILVAGIILTLLTLQLIVNKQEDKVQVIVTTLEHKAGSVITVTADMLNGNVPNTSGFEIAEIPYSEYLRLNTMKNAKTGEASSPVVLASEVGQLTNRYVSDYIPVGTTVRRAMTTTKTVTANPWLENIPTDENGDPYEIYTMAFDADDVNTRLLLPGSVIRIRAVMNVDNEYVSEVRKAIEQKEKMETSINEGKSVLQTYVTLSTSTGNNSLVNQSPVADILFNNIRIVDMINDQGESIFDIYMALLSLPLAQRSKLLNTSVSEADTTFSDRVKPAKLVFVVDKTNASLLSEFENLNGMQFKYTILANNDEDDLYSQLVGVSDSIHSFYENYNSLSQ